MAKMIIDAHFIDYFRVEYGAKLGLRTFFSDIIMPKVACFKLPKAFSKLLMI